MKLPALRIQYRIAIPFTLAFTVATVVVAFIAVSLVSTALEARLGRQMDHASEMLSESGFAVNRAILDRLKLIVDADIVTYTRSGAVVASTLDLPAHGKLSAVVRSAATTDEIFAGGKPSVIRDVTFGGQRYKVAYRALRAPPETAVAFVVATSDIEEAKATIARAITFLAALMILLMAVLSHLIARSITQPVQQLVEFTKRLAAGDWTQRAEVGSRDEIGSLALAFNDMATRLRESEARLLRSERLAAAGQVAAGVAHDIRNPLSSIKMQAQILRTKLAPGAGTHEILATILREIDRVEWVVKGLLDLVRPGELALAPTEVNAVVDRALALMEAQLAHRKVAVERRLDPGAPKAVLDADRLTQALLNVILNAADAMPNGGTLTVATSGARDGGAAVIEIADDGVGLPPGVRERVFEPFFTTKRDGVGLGLVNTRSVVERHGGSITLEPGAPRGTRAVITLPVAGPVSVTADAGTGEVG